MGRQADRQTGRQADRQKQRQDRQKNKACCVSSGHLEEVEALKLPERAEQLPHVVVRERLGQVHHHQDPALLSLGKKRRSLCTHEHTHESRGEGVGKGGGQDKPKTMVGSNSQGDQWN